MVSVRVQSDEKETGGEELWTEGEGISFKKFGYQREGK